MGDRFVIKYQGCYWRPKSCGYTSNILCAGIYGPDNYAVHSDRGDVAIPLEEAFAELLPNINPEVLAALTQAVERRIRHAEQPSGATTPPAEECGCGCVCGSCTHRRGDNRHTASCLRSNGFPARVSTGADANKVVWRGCPVSADCGLDTPHVHATIPPKEGP